jgi:sec-independent protein translocase protein TatB
VFGVSFPELMLIGAVALIIVGPQRLPGMLGTLGKWSNKLRRMLFDVRQQSGIDDILRAEGISGGLKEIRDLRNAVRGNVAGLLTTGAVAPRPGVQPTLSQTRTAPPVVDTVSTITDPYADVPYDRTREYPDEGCDAYGAIPDDLWAASHPESKPTPPVVSKPPVAFAATPTADLMNPVAAVVVADAALAVVSTGATPTTENTSEDAREPSAEGEAEPVAPKPPVDGEPLPDSSPAPESTPA